MLYVVTPVHNRASVTAKFLDALARQRDTEYTLVLVDDGCTDDTVARARAVLPPQHLEVLHGNGNLWWAGALQLAYEHLRSIRLRSDDAVLIINDDVQFESDFLSSGLAALRANPDSCIQATGVDPETGRMDHGAVADTRRLSFRAARPEEAPNCLSTRGLLMAAPTFTRSGGFRPRWLPHYLSDYEFTIRLARRGVRLMTDSSFRLISDYGTTGEQTFSGKGIRAYLHHSMSNRAMYNPKHWSAFAAMVCPPWLTPLVVARIWTGFVVRGLLIALRRQLTGN